MRTRFCPSRLGVVLGFVAATCSSAVLAQQKLNGWQFIGEFESGVVQSVDMNTLRKERGYVRVKTLVDHKKPVWSVTSKRIYSEVDEHYVDCNNRMTALLAAASYECRMAKCGPKETYSYVNEPLDFRPITTAESLGANLHELVCQK
jgi:hypothetical protein